MRETELVEELRTVRRPGDFFTSGTAEILAPRLEVDGIGVVALPLLAVQARALVAVAERAPYGRGAETLVDTDVRRTWQIGADRVRIGGKHWASTLQAIVARAAEGLGVGEPIAAELYKLLVYDEGSFFVSHRDTEKAPGMFATLVLVLPSVSTGGELMIRHEDREVRLDLKCEDPSEAAFAAFYADCVHEVLPITSGCRLALIYNLLRKGKGPKPEPPNYTAEQARVAALLQAWIDGRRAGKADESVPEKLIYPLEHTYTPAGLGFDALKGADAAVAGVLVVAAPQAGCDLYLALMSIDESGAADYAENYYPRRGRWSDDDDEQFEAGEVFDRDARLSEWRRPDGTVAALGRLPVDDDELCPPDVLADMEPDEEEFHEATGNEGASFERTYRRAALVLWPRERFFAVLNQAGRAATLPHLADLVDRWAAAGADRDSPLWNQAHELAGHMLATWPVPHEWWRDRDEEDEKDEVEYDGEPYEDADERDGDDNELDDDEEEGEDDADDDDHEGEHLGEDKHASEVTRMLALLTRLGDTDHIRAFVARPLAGGRHAKHDNAAILGALDLLPPDERSACLGRIVAANAVNARNASGNLLARAVAALPRERTGLRAAASALIDALPGDPARAPKRQAWQAPPPGVKPSFVVDLLAALAALDEALAARAADHILAWPKAFGLDAVLVPALRELAAAKAAKTRAAVQRLRDAALAHLRVRAAEPLEAPKDWRRAAKLGCRCADCTALGKFLADGQQSTWTLKAAAPARAHVEDTIRQAQCDLDFTTVRRGSPHSLVCTKNQASHDRRMKQRSQDLADLDRLNE
jgi:hypothetical protein